MDTKAKYIFLFLVLLSLSFVLQDAAAFKTRIGSDTSFLGVGQPIHWEIIKDALWTLGFEQKSLQIIREGCDSQDWFASPKFTASPHHHSDDNQIQQSYDYIKSQLDYARILAENAYKDQKSLEKVLYTLGEAFHTLQDFYSHSNYVEWLLYYAKPIKIIDWDNIPGEIRSGYFYYHWEADNEASTSRKSSVKLLLKELRKRHPDIRFHTDKEFQMRLDNPTFENALKYVLGPQEVTHYELNKDEAGSLEGQIVVANIFPVAGETLYSLARRLATEDTQRHWKIFEEMVRDEYPKKAQKIILSLKAGKALPLGPEEEECPGFEKIHEAFLELKKNTAGPNANAALIKNIHQEAKAINEELLNIKSALEELAGRVKDNLHQGGPVYSQEEIAHITSLINEAGPRASQLRKSAEAFKIMACELGAKARMNTDPTKARNLAYNANEFAKRSRKSADETEALFKQLDSLIQQLKTKGKTAPGGFNEIQTYLKTIPEQINKYAGQIRLLNLDYKTKLIPSLENIESLFEEAAGLNSRIQLLLKACPNDPALQHISKNITALYQNTKTAYTQADQYISETMGFIGDAQTALDDIAAQAQAISKAIEPEALTDEFKDLKAGLDTIKAFEEVAREFAVEAEGCAQEVGNFARGLGQEPETAGGISGYPPVIPNVLTTIEEEKKGPYYVFLLTNASYGLYLGSEDSLKGKSKCSFEGGGIDCKANDFITYDKLLGPFEKRAEAQAALCQNITESYFYPLGIGLKGQWQGDDKKWYGLWEESVSFDCKSIVQAGPLAGAGGQINIKNIHGDAQYERGDTWQQLVQSILLKENDGLKTGGNSKVEFSFPKGKITLGDNTEFRINRLRPQAFGQLKFAIQKGSLLAEIDKDIGGNFYIKTPTVTITVSGTKFAVIIREDNSTDVLVYEGKVKIENESLKKEAIVEPGKKINATGDAFSSPLVMSKQEGEIENVLHPQAQAKEAALPSKPITTTTGLPTLPTKTVSTASAETAASILNSPSPWQYPNLQQAIDAWLRIAKPNIQDGTTWSYDEWGRSYNNATIKKPTQRPDTHLDRYQYLWGMSSQLSSVAHLSLREYVEKVLRGEAVIPKEVSARPAVAPVVKKPEPPEGTPTGTGLDQAAPGFNTADIYGKRFDITQLRSKAVVIIFWTDTHDPQSRMAISALQKFADQFSKENLNVVSICMRETQEDLKSFAADKGLDYIHLLDAQWTIGKSYNLNFFPQFFVLDGRGVIKFSGYGRDVPNSADFQNALREAVEEARQYR